jgi:Uma2 family endonuclease
MTPEEYLVAERAAAYKSEYVDSKVRAMSGASEEHNLIAVNVVAALHAQLRTGPCKVYPSDMRVKVSATGSYVYPDVTVVCGGAQFEDDKFDTLLNPTVIVEILSPSTEGYDRGKKFAHYRKLASLMEYVVIAQDAHHVEHYVRRPDDRWMLSEIDGEDGVIELPSVDCRLSLADVYEKVDIPSRGRTAR